MKKRDPSDSKVEAGQAVSPAGDVRVEPESQRERGEKTTVTRGQSPLSAASALRPRGEAGFVPGQLLAERYRIVSLLGAGGMGEVYRADDLTLGQSVALKFLKAERAQEPEPVARFLDEVRLSRQITHPNVCRVFDVGEEGGVPFLSMQYIEGEDLASLLRRIGRLPQAKALEIARQICDALAAAHDLGILHRDLKPANVMIDAHGAALITDFGLAALYGTVTGSDVRSGTAAYMAPEQAASRDVSHKSDLYALGMVLYEMFTGRRFVQRTPGVQPDLDSPAEASAEWREFDDVALTSQLVIQRCLQTEADDRPRSARDVGAAFLAGGGLDAGARIAPLVAVRVPRGEEIGSVFDLSEEGELARALAEAADRREGREIRRGSRGLSLLFDSASNAVNFALELQEALAVRRKGADDAAGACCGVDVCELTVRHVDAGAGLSGEVEIATTDATRFVDLLATLAEPGQTLLGREAFDQARRVEAGSSSEELCWLAHGEYRFEEIGDHREVYEVGLEGKAPLRAPEGSSAAQRAAEQATILGWRPAPGLPIPRRPEWRVVEKLGEGGFGEVWLARHERTGEQRVFKFCYETERLHSLQREVTLLRLLKEELGERRDIIRVIDWDLEQAPYYIELPYARAGNLTDWVRAQGGAEAIPVNDRVEIVAQVADALSAAHSVGVLHKDVKPANILIFEESEGGPRAALTDFGVGSVTDRERLAARGITAHGLTQVVEDGGTTTGTQLYVAPELLAGNTATVKADLYALGVTLYQLVVADLERPLAPGWERHVQDETLREDIASLVDGNPDRRPRSAGEVADLLRSLEGRRRAREESRREAQAAQRATRRRRIAIVLAGVFGVFALVVGVLGLQAHRARQDAERRSQQAEQLVDFMLTDLHEGLERIGRLDLLESVGRGAQGYFETLTRRDLTGTVGMQRGQTLLQTGDVLYESGDAEGALQSYRDALGLFESSDSRATEKSVALAASLVRVGRILSVQGEAEEASLTLERALSEAREASAAAPGDLAARFLVARSLYASALASRRAGDHEAAVARLTEAVSVASDLVASESPSWRHVLLALDLQIALGDLSVSRSLYDEGLAHLEQARAMAGAQAEVDPANATWERRLASVHDSVGFVHFLRGDWTPAVESLQAAAATYRRLARIDPDRARWRTALASTLTTLVVVNSEGGRPEDALAPFLEAFQILEEQAAADPTRVDLRAAQARLQQSVATAYVGLGATEQALETTRKAHDLREEILALTGGEPGPANELAWSHVLVGNLLLGSGAAMRAHEEWEAALSVIENVTRTHDEPVYWDTHAQALLKLGRLEEAEPIVRELISRGWDDAVFLATLDASGLGIR